MVLGCVLVIQLPFASLSFASLEMLLQVLLSFGILNPPLYPWNATNIFQEKSKILSGLGGFAVLVFSLWLRACVLFALASIDSTVAASAYVQAGVDCVWVNAPDMGCCVGGMIFRFLPYIKKTNVNTSTILTISLTRLTTAPATYYFPGLMPGVL